jgi:hypothetical protein
MSYKDANAKQTQNCRDRFNHFYAPCCLQGTSDGPRWFQDRFINGFVPTGAGADRSESAISVR